MSLNISVVLGRHNPFTLLRLLEYRSFFIVPDKSPLHVLVRNRFFKLKLELKLILFYRNKKDEDVISIDSESEADDDSAGLSSVTWDLSRALLQTEQMVEARCRKSPLGNCLVLTVYMCQLPE
jgi:hypothetical protein